MLRQLIGALPIPKDERLLAGFEHAEDAAVYQVDDSRAVVVSIDVITPLVDDAHLFGRIAAANALSDLYAMGADPLISLSFVCIPGDFPIEVAQEILRGGGELALAAGAPIVGGHSVEGQDVMFGLAVVGHCHPKKLFRNDALRVGDRLVLTKPLGTGTLTTALKNDRLSSDDVREALEAMAQTSAAAVAPLRAHDVRAVTDITGFGFLGHGGEMAKASGVLLQIEAAAVPGFPRAREMLAAGVVTRGNRRNDEYIRSQGTVEGEPEPLLLDPQTSGGLLVGVSPERVDSLVETLRAAGYEGATIVGEVCEGAGLRVV